MIILLPLLCTTVVVSVRCTTTVFDFEQVYCERSELVAVCLGRPVRRTQYKHNWAEVWNVERGTLNQGGVSFRVDPINVDMHDVSA